MDDSQKDKQKIVEFRLTGDTEFLSRLDIVNESLYSVFRSLPKSTHDDCKALAIAGSHAGEGASLISLLSALAIRTDPANSILLVDGNLRKPELHTYLGTEQSKGLVELVEQDLVLSDILYEEKQSGFHFLQAGLSVESPSAFFGSDKFSNTLLQLKENYRYIIFDCAPVLRAPETSILAGRLTGTIMVVLSESTRHEVVSSAKQRLVDANANIAGIILNKKKHYIPEWLYKRL